MNAAYSEIEGSAYIQKIRWSCGDDEGEQRDGGRRLFITKLKNKWCLGADLNRIYLLLSPGDSLHSFPQQCRRAQTPEDLIN